MNQEKLYPLSEALKRLDDETGSTWEPHHFYEAVLRSCKGLMLKAAPPLGAEVRMFGHRPGIDRGMVCKTKSFGWGMALLYEQQVQQLQMRGETSVIHAEEVAKNPQPHINDEFWFTRPGTESPEPVRITTSDVQVPEHILRAVITAALSDDSMQRKRKLSDDFDAQQPEAWSQTEDEQKEAAPANDTDNAKPKYTWDEHALRKLLIESKEPGITQKKLGERYQVSRPFIGKMLKKAKDELGPKVRNALDPSTWKPKK